MQSLDMVQYNHMNTSKTIVSGIRATGRLHVGNYLGALKQFIELQNSGQYDCYFFIADLHALTTPFHPQELRQNTLEVAADYLAAGIDPEKSTFFVQSHIQEHTELAWIFNCLMPLGELERMTQFKDKSQQHSGSINAGLLTYPSLMAADILMYKPLGVPVGEDQVQHVELARVAARKFNNAFGLTFPEPQHIIADKNIARVKSLADPAKKMSKSEPAGCLFLDDDPEEIQKKIKKAVTATDAAQGSPGTENLLYMLNIFGTPEEKERFKNLEGIKFSELKEVLAGAIAGHFEEFREKKKELLARPDRLAEILAQGSAKARGAAQSTMTEVKEKIGLI
jgi:tryptophanyl-tRNA synthetase